MLTAGYKGLSKIVKIKSMLLLFVVAYKDPDLDVRLDNDDDDEEEVYTTRPFQPGAASTPYHDWGQYEM